jgi:PAS domain S-box-containing protein
LRRKSEETARQEAEIETVYRTAPIGLALFDPVEFRYLRLNDRQAAFFGLKPEQVVGKTLTEMAPIPGLRELFEQVRDGQHIVNYPLEGELVSHPDEHRYWTVNYSPVLAADGSVQAISAASLEITQQKRAETALIQSEKLAAVGRLASSISHEINNPLESVTNLLYLISTQQGLPSDVKTYVELTQAELARVTQIATQTLRFHRQSVKPSLVSGEQLVKPVLNLYQGRLMNSGVTVETEFGDSIKVSCLENEIRQVLNNLIANAIDAMRTGGRLMLRSHRAVDAATGREGLRIVVADTGQGMSAATLARIFEPFFTTKELNGTGLGLWISAEIVERHKGRLTVRSSQHGRYHGTIFCLFLPVGEV